MIMVRTLRRDIAKYNTDDSFEDTLEETGWKLVHGDVFRAPRHPRLFAAIIGTGIQIFFMAFITIFVAMLGMLSPSSRGALMRAAIMLFVFMGLIAGYFSARLYKTMKGKDWKKTAFFTATLFPGVVFGTCFFLNFFIWGSDSSGAIRNNGWTAAALVRNFTSARVSRLLFWLPEASLPASSSHQHDSTTDPKTTVVYERVHVHAYGWHLAIRCCLHRAVLRVQRNLAESVLLSVWISFSGILHLGRQLWPIVNCDDLLPTVR